MTREDVIKLFPEATDEQITKLLNQNNSEVAKEKGKSESLKAEIDSLKESATNAEELQKKIEEIEQSKMTETEKIAKELEKSNAKVAELEKSISIQNQRAAAAESYKITAEQAKQVIKDDGTVDHIVLGQIIADKESAAALAKEQEIANLSGNPGGQGADGGGDGKSSAVKLVERHFGGQKQNNDILSHYLNGGN